MELVVERAENHSEVPVAGFHRVLAVPLWMDYSDQKSCLLQRSHQLLVEPRGF
jgi:hypothetical protein